MVLKVFLCMGLALMLGSSGNSHQEMPRIPGNWENVIKKEILKDEEVVGNPLQVKSGKRKKNVSITISAVGDCTFGSDQASPSGVDFYAVKKSHDYDYFFKHVKKVFAKDDLTIANFEGTLTKRGKRQPKKYAFRGDPSYVNILKKGSIEAVSFANNHCRDFGEVSYQDTKQTLKKAGIRFASYSRTEIYKVKGKRIGMVAVCGLEGLTGSKALVNAGIKKLKKKKADLIIVSMHAGIEYQKKPDSIQKSLSHYAIDRGADLVLGHHPHIIQGIEKYKGRYIAYSLGNFCFGGNTNPSDKDTMIYQQTFYFKGQKKRKKTKVMVIPCALSSKENINNYQPCIAGKVRSERIFDRLWEYSPSVKMKKTNSKTFLCQ